MRGIAPGRSYGYLPTSMGGFLPIMLGFQDCVGRASSSVVVGQPKSPIGLSEGHGVTQGYHINPVEMWPPETSRR